MRTLPTAIGVVMRLAWSTSPGLSTLAGVVHLVSGFVTVFGLLATAQVFTALLQQGPTPGRVIDSLPGIALLVASYAVRSLLDTAIAAAEAALRPRVSRAADDRVTEAVIGVELLAFEDADFRELVRQGGRNGLRSIGATLGEITRLVAAIVSMLAALVTVCLLNAWLAPVLLLAALAQGWATGRVARLRYRNFLDTVPRLIRKAVIEEAATHRRLALERHALTLQDRLLADYRRTALSLMRDEIRLEHRSNWVRFTGRAAAGVGTALAYLVLGFLLYTGTMELALAGTAVLAMRTASGALSTTMRAVSAMYEYSFYIDFYNQLLSDAARRTPAVSAVTVTGNPQEILVDRVSFTYPGQDRPALQDVTLTLHRGEVIALVGENGSGKTTLGKILTGLYPPSRGTVYWDGIDLATADPNSVHAQIAVVAQHPAEWPMTARRNIISGRLDRQDPARAAWHHALHQSGADEVLASLPQGADTVLSRHFADGQDLSGGQWQRLGIARALYRDAAVLLVDEPTSALDAKAESQVFNGLRSASSTGTGKASRTTIVVTHRLANARTADRIVVLGQGRIVEQGTHDELIARAGLYRELYEIQANSYQPVDMR